MELSFAASYEDLAPLDPVIVSGFAYGVDIVHQFAMEYKLQTIG
jgi:DNA processing protein